MKCLKFQSEAAAIAAFAPWATDEATYPAYIGTVAVDVVGVIHKPTGDTLIDSEGNSYPDMQPIPGWHVNLSGDCPADLAPFLIEVAAPVRVFA